MKKYSEMSNLQLIDEFNKIWKESNVSRSNINRYLKNHFHELYSEIEFRTIKLNQHKFDKKKNGRLTDISVFERIYCLQHGLNDRPLCAECHKKYVAGFMPYRNEYSQYCSQRCQRHSSIQAKRGIETRKKKYGEENFNNFEKAHLTRIARYGQHHPKDFSSKVKMTKNRRHGDENYVNVAKMKATVKKHREENPSYYADREQKTKMTKIKNGHDSNWNNRKKFKETISSFSDERKEEIKDKRRQTCLDNYGCEFPTQNKEVQKKRIATCQDLYGVSCTLNIQHAKEAAIKKIREDAWDGFMACNNEIIPLFSRYDFILNNSNDMAWRWKCKKCGHEFEHKWKNFSRRCPICHPLTYHEEQQDLAKFIRSICPNDNIIENCRTILSNGKELDIVDVDKKIAIEFNGLIWHNVDKQVYNGRLINRMYHYNKTNECNDKGYQLIHIFEDEWIENIKLCKSMLEKMFTTALIRHVDASKCSIDENVDDVQAMKFIEKYSFVNKSFDKAHALRHNGHIVAMMAFAKSKNPKYEWNIVEYAEVNSFSVDNGFSILINHFASKVHSQKICYIMSRDWNFIYSIGHSMRFVSIEEPTMYWMKKQTRFAAYEITKSNMHNWLSNIDNEKSFLQNMNANGFYRIYDSGSFLCEFNMRSK